MLLPRCLPRRTIRGHEMILLALMTIYIILTHRLHHMSSQVERYHHQLLQKSLMRTKTKKFQRTVSMDGGQVAVNIALTVENVQEINPFLAPKNEAPVIYRPGSWDGAPIVIEEYKLVFFTQPKVCI